MAKTKLQELKYRLREISIFDRLKARVFKYPSSYSSNCETYDEWLDDFLSDGVQIVSVTQYNMTLKNAHEKVVTFWVENYPYSYGCRNDVTSSHSHWKLTPKWSLVLKLREIQLSRKQEVIENYKHKMLTSK
ncbi:hypothetical protein MARILYN_46 [Vibrio phage Marilyn]|nr:hypothetical protein MARILYN_46 [Vibrio phage Marilyn]WCD55569.1 hypothetical protein FAYDEN_46 [Vibrio phage Fayden]WCD55627.1 hypothetical protein BAYBAE_47 [Vibrio phage Baybae]WCD55685.1 hypothetical protein VAITEPHAGE_46 [Vibrio phage Vaitephage]